MGYGKRDKGTIISQFILRRWCVTVRAFILVLSECIRSIINGIYFCMEKDTDNTISLHTSNATLSLEIQH